MSTPFSLSGWYLGEVPPENKKKAVTWPLQPVSASIRIENEDDPSTVSVVFELENECHRSQARYIEPVEDSARFYTGRVGDSTVGFAFTTREESTQFMQALKECLRGEPLLPASAGLASLPPAGTERSASQVAAKSSRSPSESNKIEKVLLTVFFLEGFINLFSGLYIMGYPGQCLSLFGVDAQPETQDIFRWFGSLTVLLGYIGLRAPVSNENIEGLLLGDILYLAVWYHFINLHGVMNVWAIWPAGILVVFLALSRVVFLLIRAKNQKHRKHKNE